MQWYRVDEPARHVHRLIAQPIHDLRRSIGSDKLFDVVAWMYDEEYRDRQPI